MLCQALSGFVIQNQQWDRTEIAVIESKDMSSANFFKCFLAFSLGWEGYREVEVSLVMLNQWYVGSSTQQRWREGPSNPSRFLQVLLTWSSERALTAAAPTIWFAHVPKWLARWLPCFNPPCLDSCALRSAQPLLHTLVWKTASSTITCSPDIVVLDSGM